MMITIIIKSTFSFLWIFHYHNKRVLSILAELLELKMCNI